MVSYNMNSLTMLSLNRHWLTWIVLISSLLIGFNPYSNAWALILVESGGSQSISAGAPSEAIVFKISDALGHVQTGVTVNFTLLDGEGKHVVNGLNPLAGMPLEDGTIQTYFTPTGKTGNYTITALLATDARQFANTNIVVHPATPTQLIVVSGKDQTLSVDEVSEAMVFQLADSFGNPISQQVVNFTLITPAGEETRLGLTLDTAITDIKGQVSTALEATDKEGTYIVAAALSANPTITARIAATRSKPTPPIGQATVLTVITGDKQSIPANTSSAPLSFQLTDSFKNPVANEKINFELTTPNSSSISSGLTLVTATTDSSGKVSTRLTPKDVVGNYTITATVVSQTSVKAVATLSVTPALPQLPSLGFGTALQMNGSYVDTQSSFSGGASVNGSEFKQEIIKQAEEVVTVQGMIRPEQSELGQQADILVVAVHTPLDSPNESETFYMLDKQGNPMIWNGYLDSLVSFKEGVTLSSVQLIDIYHEKMIPGVIRIYFGYRLSGSQGRVVYNKAQSINVLVE